MSRGGKWSVKRRLMECEEEVNGMLGVGKKSGIITAACYIIKNFRWVKLGCIWVIFSPYHVYDVYSL